MTKNALIVLLFNCLIVVQSCKVYQNNTTSLERIISTNDIRFKKIKTIKGKTYHLRRIETKDGKLYGSKYKVGEMLLLEFMIEDIDSIRIQNKSASIGATIIVGTGIGIALVFSFFLITFDLN